MVFAVEGWEERLLSSLHAYVWLVLLKRNSMVVFVFVFIFVVLLSAGINIAVQGSLFTVANEVVHPNFQVSRSLEILCRQVPI